MKHLLKSFLDSDKFITPNSLFALLLFQLISACLFLVILFGGILAFIKHHSPIFPNKIQLVHKHIFPMQFMRE